MSAAGLFPSVLSDRWEALPEPVRRAHAGTGAVTLAGRARAFGSSGRHETFIAITSEPDRERWRRRFGSRGFASTLVRAKNDPMAFEETIGLFTFRCALAPRRDGFAFAFRCWRLGPIPLPRAWAPRVRARTFARDGVYRFRVLVAHPWLGVIFGYAGRLS